jgi:hypothetical protein
MDRMRSLLGDRSFGDYKFIGRFFYARLTH